jgi:acyl carrier protein
MAETTLMVCGKDVELGPAYKQVDPKQLTRNHIVSANGSRAVALVASGQISDMHVEIVDPNTRKRRKHREVGEIWVRGPSVGGGYWRKNDETNRTFRACLEDVGERFLRTGDLGFVDDGLLYVVGRHKDVLIIRGSNYYPQDIEATVQRSHPWLRRDSGAAFTMQTPDNIERLVITQEVKREHVPKTQADPETIFDAIVSAVRREHGLTPATVVLLRPLGTPKTSSGKVQRSLCRDTYVRGQLPVLAARSFLGKAKTTRDFFLDLQRAPPLDRRKVLIRQLQSMAKEILEITDYPDPTKGFGELDMDSASIADLLCCLEQQYSVALSEDQLYASPTIEQLADIILQRLFGGEHAGE